MARRRKVRGLVSDNMEKIALDALLLHDTVCSFSEATTLQDLLAMSAGSCLGGQDIHIGTSAVKQLQQTYLPEMVSQGMEPLLLVQRVPSYVAASGVLSVHDAWHIGSAAQLELSSTRALERRAEWEATRADDIVAAIQRTLQVRHPAGS